MYTEQKNNKKLKALYEQSLHIKSAIPHPLIMGVIRGTCTCRFVRKPRYISSEVHVHVCMHAHVCIHRLRVCIHVDSNTNIYLHIHTHCTTDQVLNGISYMYVQKRERVEENTRARARAGHETDYKRGPTTDGMQTNLFMDFPLLFDYWCMYTCTYMYVPWLHSYILR